MTDPLVPKQLWLFNYENPLPKRFGPEFFKSIPKSPGVYRMYGADKNLLYVGKAKNLQNRLRSYRQVKPENSSRKVLRLVHRIIDIQWEECETEEAALLRENHLLRTHRPPFNTMNTRPESYYFIGFRSTSRHLHLRLTTSPQLLDSSDALESEADQLFGAFKGRGITRRGFASFLRLLWACLSESETEKFEFPGVLVRKKTPYSYSILVSEQMNDAEKKLWESNVRRFLKGTSQRLLTQVTQRLLDRDHIPAFMYTFIQEDLEVLTQLFQYGPLRNKRLRKFHGIEEHWVAQEKIDDLLVTYWKKSS